MADIYTLYSKKSKGKLRGENMKIIYGLNVTTDKQNKVTDEVSLTVKTTTKEQEEKIDKAIEDAKKFVAKHTMPWWAVAIQFALLATFAISIIYIISLRNAGETLKNIYSQKGIFFYIAFIALIALLASMIYERKRKRISPEEDSEEITEIYKKIPEESFNILGIPSDAEEIDVLACRYKEKDNSFSLINNLFVQPKNVMRKIYKSEDTLYLADEIRIIGIPLKSIKDYSFVKKTILLTSWNKNESCTSEKYARFEIMVRNKAMLSRGYYQVNININDEKYILNIMDYDIDLFINLANLK